MSFEVLIEQPIPSIPPESEREYNEGPKAKGRQIVLACRAHMGSFIMATVWAWSATALPSIREDQSELGEISATLEAWIAPITFIAGMVGSFLMGYIAESKGLKTSLMIASAFLFFGWLVITFAHNVNSILLGRFMTGFFIADMGVSNNLVAEYSKKDRRGGLNFIFEILFCDGILFIYIIGTLFPWRIQAGSCAAACAIFFLFLLTIPESPIVLVKQGRKNSAEEALKYIRDKDDVDDEVKNIEAKLALENTKKNARNEAKSWEYLNKEILKPIIIVIFLQFFLQVCGVVHIVCYALDVFKAAGNSQFSEYTSTIVLGLINMVATMFAHSQVDKSGRRKLMMLSETLLTFSLFFIGLFLYLKTSSLSYEKYDWLLLFLFVIFMAAYSVGVGPLPWVVMGEITAPSAKGFSSGVINFAARLFGFLVMFFFKDFNLLIGQHGVYWFFAAVCLSGLFFTYFFLPETKGRSLEEIQDDLKFGWLQHRSRPRANKSIRRK